MEKDEEENSMRKLSSRKMKEYMKVMLSDAYSVPCPHCYSDDTVTGEPAWEEDQHTIGYKCNNCSCYFVFNYRLYQVNIEEEGSDD